ncbi:MAG: DctP family TRAP transporter solute-binding subunit [Spirochaetales bacterium]|jgi:tripartite ATP-independent transporter DctP family solute receptor|nr:DctP family TRAP transporter solute-binding subunit [Spirochaetales bacterium]
MKKYFMVLLIAAAALAVAGCSGQGSGASAGDSASTATVKLSAFAGSLPRNTPTGIAMEFFVSQINEKAGGSLQTASYYDTELGDATSLVQGLQHGTVDIGVCGDSYYSGLVPEIQIYELPFLFANVEEARKAVDGPTKDIIFKKLEEKGIIGLCFWENGMRQLSNNVRPVKTPADLKGIKMRTLPATIQVEAWKALGALPTSIDASELYTALQVGTVSAQENPIAEIEFRKFHEVQKYISLTNHVYTPFCLSMSKVTANKLSPTQVQIIKDAAIAAQKVQRDAATSANASAMQKLIEKGVIIEEHPDLSRFKELTAPVYKIFTDANGDELLKMIRGK